MYELSTAAAEDIEEILERSVADFGLQQTQRYFDSLKTCLRSLADNPQMGGAADDIRPGYRRFPHESHVIFYQLTQRGIFVVRVLHKRMDVTKRINE